MKAIKLSVLILSLTIKALSQPSYIQIIAEPEISVFLDDSFKGKTTLELGGLIIEKITSGQHSIKVVKEGFNPQVETINVKPGEVYSYKVRPFVPSLKISESGNIGQQEIDLKVGTLKIQSLPIEISISIPSLGIDTKKSRDEWKAEDIPIGNYPAIFRGMNRTLKTVIKIDNHRTTHLFINVIKDTIEDRTGMYDAEQDRMADHQISIGKNANTSATIKEYKTIRIGNQTWMSENLDSKVLNDGTPIKIITDGKTWSELALPGYCFYENKSNNEVTYGILYNWHAVESGKLCPVGWHMPNIDEWQSLISNLKSGTNYKFLSQPGGFRYSSGGFSDIGILAYWWSSEAHDSNNAWRYSVNIKTQNGYIIPCPKESGLSVRCIKD
ncbi:MAG: FISUMP domain-containing protein [Bacteroidales bacterium]